MAERVNAFKTKYTGEQLEELFDKLANSVTEIPSAGEGQCYSTEIYNTYDSIGSGNSYVNPTIETPFGFMQFIGRIGLSSNLLSLLTLNTSVGFGTKEVSIIYTFKKPVTLLKYRYKGNSYLSGIKINLYYWINNEWVNQGTYTLAEIGTITLESQIVEKVKVELNGNSNAALYYSIFDFMSDSYIVSGPAIITEE